MKTKPIVIEHYSTRHTSFVLDFHFTTNITLLVGNSGSGKTLSFSIIKEDMVFNKNLLCINYLDYNKDIFEMIKSSKGKLIVIDNADVILDDYTRKYIALDGENQYLIMSRNPKNLFATKENFFEIVSEKSGEQTILKLKGYYE